MQSFVEVISQSDLDELLDCLSGFHDSMAREFHILNRGYVNTEGCMFAWESTDVQVLVQSQCGPAGLEMIFEDILELNLKASGLCEEAEADYKIFQNTLNDSVETKIDFRLDQALRIISHKLFYRKRPNWLGKRVRLTGEVPSSQASLARSIGNKWRQCDECCDAWEADLSTEFSYCPSCNRLTELVHTDNE